MWIAVAALVVVATVGTQGQTVDDGFFPPVSASGYSYYLSRTRSPTNDIADADSACAGLGGRVAEITSQSELELVQQLIEDSESNFHGIFIDGTDEANEGVWVSRRTGEPLTFLPWEGNEPNNFGGNQDCMCLWFSLGPYGFADVDCVGLRLDLSMSFLCEVKDAPDEPDPEPPVTGGPPCPPGVCSTRAVCQDGECVCTGRYVWGDGRLSCYKKNQVGAEIVNDPTLKTFNNENAQFPYPCRYLVTDVRQELKVNNQVVGTCRCQVHAWNQRWKGKFYPAGFDLSCDINNEVNPGYSFGFSIRKSGLADNNEYEYQEWGSNSYTPNGPWSTTPVNINQGGVKVKCERDPDDNVVRVNVRECGLEAYLRAYDTTLRRQQPQRPGLAIGINCAHHPEFLQNDKVMALAPVGFNGEYLHEITIGTLDVADSVLARAFLQSSVQNQPNAPPSCESTSSTLHYCEDNELETALQRCSWMLRRAKFINCINGPPNDDAEPEDANAELILRVFHACVQTVCSEVSCEVPVQLIQDAGCTGVINTPELAPYLADCPPQPPPVTPFPTTALP